jgi:acetyl-CoA carboxylase carboxyl transferase subunit alpha
VTADSGLSKEIALTVEITHELSAWDHVQLARHENRPYSLDHIDGMIDDFTELHGDRRYGDDGAIVAGIGFLEGTPVAVIGHQKGRTVAERRERNFGAARPDGYRKAMRVMQLAARMGRPIITLIDTPGADCLEESEGRGISEAIAANQRDMFALGVPIISVVIGEGGSGGAIGIGVGNRILMMENAYYSVIAPESCAAILWRSPERKIEAAAALKLTAKDAVALGIADTIIPEPPGGAHNDIPAAVKAVKQAVIEQVEQLLPLSPDELKRQRWAKFRAF